MDWEPYDRHWIRLRGPWQVWWTPTPTGTATGPCERSAVESQPDRTVTLPSTWIALFGATPGTATFRRRFHRPTGLEPHERVLVTICQPRTEVRAWLNDQPVAALTEPIGDPSCRPTPEGISFDVTEQLADANRISLELYCRERPTPDRPCGLWQPVLLEIVQRPGG